MYADYKNKENTRLRVERYRKKQKSNSNVTVSSSSSSSSSKKIKSSELKFATNSWETKEYEKWKIHIAKIFKTITPKKEEWCKALYDLQKLDGLSRGQIESIRCYLEEEAKTDNGFRWCDNIRTPMKLRKRKNADEPQYWEQVLMAMKKKNKNEGRNGRPDVSQNVFTETRVVTLVSIPRLVQLKGANKRKT